VTLIGSGERPTWKRAAIPETGNGLETGNGPAFNIRLPDLARIHEDVRVQPAFALKITHLKNDPA
jgi:hypothetical protein